MMMPSSVGSSLLAFGAILTSVSDTAGCIVAGAGLAWEFFLLIQAGL